MPNGSSDPAYGAVSAPGLFPRITADLIASGVDPSQITQNSDGSISAEIYEGDFNKLKIRGNVNDPTPLTFTNSVLSGLDLNDYTYKPVNNGHRIMEAVINNTTSENFKVTLNNAINNGNSTFKYSPGDLSQVDAPFSSQAEKMNLGINILGSENETPGPGYYNPKKHLVQHKRSVSCRAVFDASHDRFEKSRYKLNTPGPGNYIV